MSVPQIIEWVYASHRVPVRVDLARAWSTSTLVVYPLLRGQGVSVAQVERLAPELDEALSRFLRREVLVRFERRPLRVEIPRPDARPPSLQPVLDRLAVREAGRGRLLTVLGENVAVPGGRPLLVDLAGPDAPHILVAGTTGSGKTTLLRAMILGLATLYPPTELGLALLDPKRIELEAFAPLPHLVAPVATDPEDALTLLRRLVAELERRMQTGETRPHLVAFVDELAELGDVTRGEAEGLIKRVVQVGRGLGIHLVGATQKPLAKEVGSIVTANFPLRVVGKVATANDARVAAGRSETFAERLPGRGAFLAVVGDSLRRFQGYAASPRAVAAMVEEVRARWAGLSPTGLPHLPVAEGPDPAEFVARGPARTGRPPGPGAPSWLREAVAMYLQEHGRLPSQRAVQRWHQEETGQMLSWPTIAALLEEVRAAADI